MNHLLRRLTVAAAWLAALAAVPAVFSAPPLSVSITAPAPGANLGVLSTPSNTVTISATAAPSGGGQSITQIDFRVNGTSVGISTVAPFSVVWTPPAPGTYNLTAIATDSSSASNNTLTSGTVTVTVTATRTVSIATPATNTTFTQNSQAVLRASAAMSDGVVGSVEFFLGGVSLGAAVTSAPYTQVATITAAPGTYNLTARATSTDGVTTWDSAATYPITVVAQTGTAPTVAFVSPAGTDVLAVGTPVTVTATASDADGFIPNTAPGGVSFFADGELIGTDLTAPYSVSWTPTLAKSVTLIAVATDDKGNSRSATRAVTVLAVAPTVAISAPANNSAATVGAAVALTANATAGVGTTITSVQFFADGVAIAAADTLFPYTATWTPAAAGTVALTARVTDSNGTVVTSSPVAVNVAAAAGTLAVSLTAPVNGASVALGTNTTFTATATAAGSNTVVRVDFLVGGSVVGTSLTAPFSFTWTPSTAGVFAVTARATDSAGGTANSTIANVSVTAPSVALTAPTAGTSVAVGTATTLTATATPVAPATVTKVDFFAGSTLVGTATAAPFTATWTPSTAGNVSLTARITDSNNAVATSTAVAVTVSSSAPTISITSPGAGSTLTQGTATPISVTATPGTGNTITRVDFFANGTTSLGTVLTAPYVLNWTPTTAGVISLTARVTDSANLTDTSPAVPVTVAAATASTVTLAMTPSSTAVPVNSARSLTATATAAAGIAYVEFYYGATLIGTDNAAPYNVVFTAPNELGSRTLRARAIDNAGAAVSSADLNITITGAIGSSPLVNIVAPNSGAFVAAGANTAISGSVSDPDGSIASVQVFVNGAVAGLGNGGTATVSGSAWSIGWTPSTSGTASITVLATDNNGNVVASPAVGVTVTDNTSPTVNLSISPRVAGVSSSTLPSGAIRNFVADVTPSSGRAILRVEFFVDGTKVGEDTTVPYTYRYVAPALAAGENSRTYVVSARATDNAGSARDVPFPLLVVAPIGTGPVVSLLTPTNSTSVFPNTAVSLAATATSAGGSIASVQFFVNGNPAPVNGGNALAVAPYTSTFTPTAPGSYTIDVVATDDRGNTTVSNSATITAAFATPTITITSPNPNATARATPNVPLTITATATVQTGAGASVLLVEYLLADDQGANEVQIGARTTATNAALGTYSFAWTPTAAQLGSRRLRARVTDTNSQTATSAAVTVNVANAVGTPPTVTITTTPIPGAGLQSLSQVNFIANAFANGTGSTLSAVEFFLNDVSIGTANREQTTNLYRLAYDFSRFDFSTLTADANGRFIVPLYAIARDSNNNQTVSATTNLAVNPSTSAPPSVQLQNVTGTTTITQGQQFFAGVISSDSDGTVALIQLYANGVVVATATNPAQGQLVTYNATVAGRFNLVAVATDDTGNTAIASPAIVLTVTAINAPTTTITRPADNATVTTVSAPVFLEGTAVNSNTTQVPTLSFIATASGGARTTIAGARVGTTTTYRAIWTPTTPDTYTVATQATVGTAQGNSTATRRVVVNNLSGLAPTITINTPGTATTASQVNFTATAADSDGAVVEVEFFLNRNSIGLARRDDLANTWRLTASFAGVPLGNAEVVALARDSSGNVAASTTNTVSVTAASSIAPSVAITPSTTTAAFNRQVQLTANARDTDGTVNSVQYFANATSIGTSFNANSNYQINWTPTQSGTFNLWAIATDNSGITTVAPTVQVTVRRNNPVLENAAFILQTYQDIANTTTINPIVFADLDAQLTAGTLSRADLVVSLVDEAGFVAPVNVLAAYWVLMGQWPTPQNYTTFLATARTNLANAVGGILGSNEYLAKYGLLTAPTLAQLNNPASVIPADTFIARLWAGAGLGAPSPLDNTRFRSNPTATATLGRGYNVGGVGLNTAVAEFITNTNSANAALFKRARAAALLYQLNRPPITVTADEIGARVDALARLPDDKAMADAVLKDVLYGFRYVTITRHPQSLTVAPRSGAIFSVEAQGAPPLAYQWLLNGAPIPGANSAILSLTNVDATRVGSYTVAVTSSAATATSDAAVLSLSTTPTRLGNISTRGVTTGAGGNVLIGGFVVTGANAQQTRQMLIRVIGPTLGNAPFNVAGVLANPRLEVFVGSNQTPILTNDNWGTQAGGAAAVTAIQQATNRAGAFALNQNSNDAVVLATLPPGPYTVQAKGPANNLAATGVVLIEVYDVTQGNAAGPKAANVSTRGVVGTGSNVLIAGFVVNGAVSRRMLIRGAGPTLANLGVPGVLADPQITLVSQATGQTIRSNNDWATGDDAAIIASAATAAGAFPFANGSRDAAMIVMLPPGAYTVQLSGVGNATGVGIVEVYDVDP